MRQSKYHRDIDQKMSDKRRWLIKIEGKWYVEHQGVPVVYRTYREAEKEATEFNSLRARGDNPYKVEEYTPSKKS
tara:strand:+ start:1226 stop:1450 length:225 start_codon:yes stop_codon:yes gene_type:complete